MLFSVGNAWLWQNIVELHIHYKPLLTTVCQHAGYKEYCNDFTVALTIFNVFYKTQMCDSVLTGRENACNDWNCIILMFLTSFIVYFVFGYACRGRTRGQGGHFPGRRKSLMMSQILSSMQNICFRKTSDSNMAASNSLLVPGAI